jgi:hypothetical protein
LEAAKRKKTELFLKVDAHLFQKHIKTIEEHSKSLCGKLKAAGGKS